ncbi:SEP domain-containing protein [Mycena rosella]|uniref:SEP domain-containing protein n=1 Tax=Mycena rosella TaxID=1033263 RepID=A0AAD7CWY5_MYCRO|nr:SEP domain-containing protein [Mycena rosella]
MTSKNSGNVPMEERRTGVSLPPPASNSESAPPYTELGATPAVRQFTFWRDGFSFGDGPLLRYDDPNNVTILEGINSGTVSPALLGVRRGQAVDLIVTQRTHEDYAAPRDIRQLPTTDIGTDAPSSSSSGGPIHTESEALREALLIKAAANK